MDKITNPFSPGAGSPPPELVGRELVLEQAVVLLERTKIRRPEKSLLLTGLRGVGKTVLLNEIEEIAVNRGYRTIFIETDGSDSLALQIAPQLRTLIFSLDRIAGAGDKVKRALGVLKGFLNSMRMSVHELTFSIDIESEKGVADSGDIKIDLPNLLISVGEAAIDKQTQVAIFIDEIHTLDSKEIRALILSMHKIQQKQLPIVLLAAGLPILPGIVGNAKSYAERLFDFPDIGPLTKKDSMKAITDPSMKSNVIFEKSALEEIYRLTCGYPYFVQEWGYQCWNIAQNNSVTLQDVMSASKIAMKRLDKNFFRVRFDRLVPSEKTFLRAMADLEGDSCKVGQVADKLGVKTSSISLIRSRLIKKGMIYSPVYGQLAFTVPLFGDFLTRSVPEK